MKIPVRILKGFEIELWQANHPATESIEAGDCVDGILRGGENNAI